jgi:serine phosphatase RsbU (regulator of sigma subunit)
MRGLLKTDLELKNKEITDSIHYAQRIQQAKLQPIHDIQSLLPNSFILFKPKDIVSGDFYYFCKHNDSVLIAAADCTGHGVPGAFMSLICTEQLDKVITETKDTSEILSKTNKGVKTSLQQNSEENSTRDSMDIALCSVDIYQKTVKFAGANRPLWIIRKGSQQVEEIKPTKQSVGGFTETDQHFDTHTIQLQQGDSLYIFSDGYADTFGGTNAKKLTTKKFKELLISIQEKSMQEQKIWLANFIEAWKSGMEQTDDILVIGVQV